MKVDELTALCRTHGIAVSLAGLIRERDVARLLDIDVRTLQRWRADGIGPDAVTIGRTWFYDVAAVAAALTPSDTRRQTTTSSDIRSIDDERHAAHTQAFTNRRA